MPTTPDQKARLVISSTYPKEYIPKARCIIYSEAITPQTAFKLARQAKTQQPSYKGLAFIEGVDAQATVKLICDTCDTRRLPYPVDFLKYFLGLQ